MESVSSEVLEQAVRLLGNSQFSDEEVEAKLCTWSVKEVVAQRLVSFIPEAFGMVAAMHMEQKPVFPQTFGAFDAKGQSEEFPFSSEPILELAKKRAQSMYKDGPREVFETVASRSSVMEAINDARESGANYHGAKLIIETVVPAEVYRKGSFWKWLMGPLWTKETE